MKTKRWADAVWAGGLLAACAVLAGCGAASSSSSSAEETGAIESDPELDNLMKLGAFRSLTPITNAASMKAAAAANGAGPFVVVSSSSGKYLAELDGQGMAAEFHGLFGENGAPSGAKALRGWSNGVDNRQVLTGASLVPEVGGVINQWGGPCSGTLIGERIVRLAAHCIVLHTTSGGTIPNNTSQTFYYKVDHNTPVTSARSTVVFFGGNYISQNCARSTSSDYWSGYRANLDACFWEDWAMLILPSNWWSAAGSVQWMGYRMLGTGDLGLRLRATGYPLCNSVNPPANCITGDQYEDRSTTCTVKAWVTTGSPARFLSDCDASAGDSGGPAWDPNTRQLIGHDQWELCTTCPVGTPYRADPNVFLGHNQWLYDYENSLRAQYPR